MIVHCFYMMPATCILLYYSYMYSLIVSLFLMMPITVILLQPVVKRMCDSIRCWIHRSTHNIIYTRNTYDVYIDRYTDTSICRALYIAHKSPHIYRKRKQRHWYRECSLQRMDVCRNVRHMWRAYAGTFICGGPMKVLSPHVDHKWRLCSIPPGALRIACGQPQAARLRPISLLRFIPTKIAWLKLSGKFRMGLAIPPLKLKILLESNPLTSIIVARRLAVKIIPGAHLGHRHHLDILQTMSK